LLRGSNDEGIELVVQDNGRGFELPLDSQPGSNGYSFGLVSMRERAQFSGGTLRITTSPGQGTRIRAHWSTGAASLSKLS
jgi:signal transduction histidine kinase